MRARVQLMASQLLLEKLKKRKEMSEDENNVPQRPECTAQLKSQFRCGVYTATHECVVPLCQGLPLGAEGVFVAEASPWVAPLSPRGSRKSSLCGIWKDEPGSWGGI